MKYLIITRKIWKKSNFSCLNKDYIIENNINFKKIHTIKPKLIFFIFWSKYIPENIFKKFTCIQFHAADLPNFKGGSPIQNQILKNIKNTKISAFRVNDKLDGGEICLKKPLNLSGSAQKIFVNLEDKVIKMIKIISKRKKINFVKQLGKGTFYKRRKPKDSELNFKKQKNIIELYNFIRCTDADGYPKAFLDFKNFKLEFFNAKIKKKNLYAEIKISKKK